MITHLKTSLTTAIEALTTNSNNTDLQLIGHSSLKDCSPLLKQAVDAKGICEKCSFKNVFGLNTNFFYIIERICKNCVNYCEKGIGSIYEYEGEIFLKRILPIANGTNLASLKPCFDGVGFPFSCDNDNKLIIYSSIPSSYLECLAVENSVITSSYPGLPQPVGLKKDSFLGRLEDSIEAISFNDVRLIDKISELISKFKNQLKLQTSKLTAKRAEFDIVDIVPTKDPKAKKGSLYYDEGSNSLRFYDGNSWRTILLSRDNSDLDNLR